VSLCVFRAPLINRAKKENRVGKIRLIKHTYIKKNVQNGKTSQTLKEEETKAREEGKKLETINVKIKKTGSYQELYDKSENNLHWSKLKISQKNFNNKIKKNCGNL
jgi:DNA mismatch repair protein MutS2